MQRLYIHPFPVRVWHWINACGFVTDDRYRCSDQICRTNRPDVVQGCRPAPQLGRLCPHRKFLHLAFILSLFGQDQGLSPGISPMRHFPRPVSSARVLRLRHIQRRTHPHHLSAYHKFNPMQSMSYQIIMLLLVPMQFVTGILLWDVQRFSATVEFFGGVRVVDTVHVLIFIVFAAFISFILTWRRSAIPRWHTSRRCSPDMKKLRTRHPQRMKANPNIP